MRKFLLIVAASLVAVCIVGNGTVARAEDADKNAPPPASKDAPSKDAKPNNEAKQDPAVKEDGNKGASADKDATTSDQKKEQTLRDCAVAIVEEIEQLQKEIDTLKSDTAADLESIKKGISALHKRAERVQGRNKKFAERARGMLERISLILDYCETNPRPAPDEASSSDKDAESTGGEEDGSGEKK